MAMIWNHTQISPKLPKHIEYYDFEIIPFVYIPALLQ